MAARRAEAVRVGEVVVEVEEDRARDVALDVRRAPRARLAEVPAQVDDDGRVVGLELARERLDGDERRSIGIHRRDGTAPADGVHRRRRGTRRSAPASRGHDDLTANLATRRTTAVAARPRPRSDPRPDRLRRRRRAAARGQGVRGGEGDRRRPGSAARPGHEAPPQLLRRRTSARPPAATTWAGRYRIDGGRLVVGDLATTEMGCEPDLMAQDQWLGQLLGAGPADPPRRERPGPRGGVREHHVRRSRGRRAGREARRPDLDGRVDHHRRRRLERPRRPVATLVFKDDGTLEVNAGCNRGSGTWKAVGGGIEVGPLMLTKMACEKDGGRPRVAPSSACSRQARSPRRSTARS